MTYSIEYLREGQGLGSDLSGPTLQEAIEHAQDEMKVRGADSARIIDVEGSGAEVWSGRNDAEGT